MLASELSAADEARRGVRTLQAHEREQLREAGKRKMNELRSLKAAVVQAHAAAKLQQQQNTSQAQSAGVLGSPRASFAAESMKEQQQQMFVTSKLQQHGAAVSHEQAGAASSHVFGPITTSSSGADSTKGNSPGLGTVATSDHSSRVASNGCLQPSGSSAVAAAAGAVAAGAAVVAANAAARAGAAAQSAPCTDTPLAATMVITLQQQHNLQQQQQQHQEQNGQRQPHSVSAVDEWSFQDPMVDMLLLQVEALMSEKQQLAAKCCGLQRENEQLAELVGHLHDTLETTVDMQEEQEQQQQQQGVQRFTIPSLDLLQLQQQTIPEEGEAGADEAGGSQGGSLNAEATAAPAAAVGVEYDPMLSQSQSPTSTREGLDADGDQLMATARLTQHYHLPAQYQSMAPAADTAAVTDSGPAGPAAEPGGVAAAAAGPEDMFLATQKQMRVAEWLAHRVHEAVSSSNSATGTAAAGAAQPPSLSWQRWQEQLPLEATSSGSSSTLTITLADA